MKNSVASYADLLSELASTRLAWAKYGVNLAVTRVGRYERELAQLEEMGPQGRGALTPVKAGRAFLLAAEISEILFASRVALDREYLVHAPRISEIFNGPDFASDERDVSNRPRNTLFELTIAAAIELAGMRAEFGQLTDVRTEFRGLPVLIEAKRPQSFVKADSNIRFAAKQLASRSLESKELRIVAICIGKILTKGTDILRATTVQAMRGRLDYEMESFFSATRRHWEKNPYVDGLLVRVNVPGIITSEDRQYHAGLMTLFTRPGLDDAKAESLRGFIGKLESGLPGNSLGREEGRRLILD